MNRPVRYAVQIAAVDVGLANIREAMLLASGVFKSAKEEAQ